MGEERAAARLPGAEIARLASAALSGEVAVAAINRHGLFVPLPASLPVHGQFVLTGYTSALELVVPGDVSRVIDAWEHALSVGTASVRTRLARVPAVEVDLQVFDVTADHGVFLCVLDLPPDVREVVDGGEAVPLRPRVGWLRKSQLAVVEDADDAVTAMLGYSAGELRGMRTLELLDPEDHSRAIAGWMSMLAEPGARRRVRLRHRLADGTWRWFDVTNLNRLNDPAHGDVLSEMVDVTDEMEAQEALRARETLLRRLTETLPVGVLQFGLDGSIRYRNDRAGELLGAPYATSLYDQLDVLSVEDRRAVLGAAETAVATGADVTVEVAVVLPDHRPRRLALDVRPLVDDASGSVTGGLVCLTDVTESVELREQLADQATYDSLTRCLNRAAILAALQERLDVTSGPGVAAVFVDLDRFKQVNDDQGHEAGDRVLVEFADRLRAGVRAGDVVGRLGGDEFLVVCSRVDTRAVALRIARRVARVVREVPVTNAGAAVRASVGVAWSATGTTTTADALVAQADQAMYASKRAGDGRPVVYEMGVVSDGSATAASPRGGTVRSTRG